MPDPITMTTEAYTESYEIAYDNSPMSSVQCSPSQALHIENPAGQRAIIDFSGDEVTYSGDIPVDESARLFFELVFGHFNNRKE